MNTHAVTADAIQLEASPSVVENIGMKSSVFIMVIAGVVAVYSISRIYMHTYAFEAGLDYFEPAFAQYWMPVLYAQISAAVAALIGVLGYLWFSRDQALDSLAPEVELNRYFTFIAWLVGYTLVVLMTGAIQGEADAAWHQVVIRDTDFTPTHIALFYLCVPALVIFGAGAFLYAKTRLPMHAKKHLVPLGIAIGGPILIMPNVGYNEWGHTFFYAEELFNAPIHWGFAGLGLALLGLGGVVIHVLQRMKELIDEVAARA